MSNDEPTPLRGDAAWRALKQDVAKRNEAAFARGREQRKARENADLTRRALMERRDRANMPTQPTPPTD
jgi:hypothetical protein